MKIASHIKQNESMTIRLYDEYNRRNTNLRIQNRYRIFVQAHISKGVQTIEDSRVLRETRITYRTLCDSFTTLDPIVI